ncbi:MAG: hypothetical protein ACUZ9M_00665 [Candidatus Scalindua sp.]
MDKIKCSLCWLYFPKDKITVRHGLKICIFCTKFTIDEPTAYQKERDLQLAQDRFER